MNVEVSEMNIAPISDCFTKCNVKSEDRFERDASVAFSYDIMTSTDITKNYDIDLRHCASQSAICKDASDNDVKRNGSTISHDDDNDDDVLMTECSASRHIKQNHSELSTNVETVSNNLKDSALSLGENVSSDVKCFVPDGPHLNDGGKAVSLEVDTNASSRSSSPYSSSDMSGNVDAVINQTSFINNSSSHITNGKGTSTKKNPKKSLNDMHKQLLQKLLPNADILGPDRKLPDFLNHSTESKSGSLIPQDYSPANSTDSNRASPNIDPVDKTSKAVLSDFIKDETEVECTSGDCSLQ